MEDTVTLARQMREKQGPWEVEVSYGGEADLHRHLTGCDKNPGHHKFVPVDQFNVDHLPPGCQDNDLVDLVRAMSDITVRVSAKYVSEDRPETFPGSGKPYPCYKNRGGNMMRVGTGLAWKVEKYIDVNSCIEQDNTNKHSNLKTCTCQECRISPTPKTQFAHILIYTAAHVVYDDLEAAHTTCHFFFDKGGTPRACSGVVTLKGMSVEWSNDIYDICELTYVTHDLDLADGLKKMADRWRRLRKEFNEKVARIETEKQKPSSPGEETAGDLSRGLPDALDNMIIIVSHPHGCSKQVSVGYSVDTDPKGGRKFPRTYTTATCPGSSGAYVCLVKDRYWSLWNDDLVHSGGCESDKNVNFCSLVMFQPMGTVD